MKLGDDLYGVELGYVPASETFTLTVIECVDVGTDHDFELANYNLTKEEALKLRDYINSCIS